jgi:hypothetical protein
VIQINNKKLVAVYECDPKIKKKMEFSKIISLGVITLVVFIILFSCFMIFRTNNLMPLQYLIPSAFTSLSIVLGFYFNKSKAENTIKISNYNNEEC